MSKPPLTEPVKFYSFDRFGIDNLVLKEEEAKPLGTDEVRVRMHAASLNYRDLLMIKGLYDPKVLSSGGLIPLSDGAGEVIEIGSNVDRFKIGDRVAAIFIQDWLAGECTQPMTHSALGGSINGVLATHKVFKQEGLVNLPEDYSYEQAATLPCAAVTAWHALFDSAKLKAGDTVLIQGTGGVSIFALQFAKMSGAKVILISSSDEKLQQAKNLGADHLINYKKNPDWEIEARNLTGSRGVDCIVEVGGAQTLSKSFKAVRMGGKIIVIGILGGVESNISLLPILMKNLCLQGIYVGSRTMFEEMNKAINANKMYPVIDRVFPFSETADAFHHLESGQHFGKIVIKIQ